MRTIADAIERIEKTLDVKSSVADAFEPRKHPRNVAGHFTVRGKKKSEAGLTGSDFFEPTKHPRNSFGQFAQKVEKKKKAKKSKQ
jgi:hypothetical protein